jgi:hypothetical protein
LTNSRAPVPFQISWVRASVGLLVTGILVGEVGLVVGLSVGLNVTGALVGLDDVGEKLGCDCSPEITNWAEQELELQHPSCNE